MAMPNAKGIAALMTLPCECASSPSNQRLAVLRRASARQGNVFNTFCFANNDKKLGYVLIIL
jgi:hypothetical protein